MKLRFNRNAFTVIELLVIITVLGVLVTLIIPMITHGSDASRVRTATRGAMQMSRYARTMAVLHQNAMVLTFSADGKINVALEGGGHGGGESIVSAKAFGTTNATAEAEAAKQAEFEAGHDDTSGGKGHSYSMADVNTEKSYEQVTFEFLGYTDTADAGRASYLLTPAKITGVSSNEEAAASVRYKSNGTCRPYRVKVSAEGDNAFSLTVAVDMLGAAKVEEDGR